MSIAITILVGGQPLIAELDEAALADIAAAVAPAHGNNSSPWIYGEETAAAIDAAATAADDFSWPQDTLIGGAHRG